MTNKIKASFDGIRAEDKLKSDTAIYLNNKIAIRHTAKGHTILRRYVLALLSVVILFMSGTFMHNLYFTPAAYVDVDVNPSIELTLNRFDRVIDSYAYNNDGEDILDDLSLTHKSYEDALIILMEAMAGRGYIQEDVLISVTLQTDNSENEMSLLDDIQTGIEGYMMTHHQTVKIEVFPVSSDTRNYSQEQDISPAKYLAIQRLMEVDPTASIENCRGHTISKIKQLTHEHANHHNNGIFDDISDDNGNADNDDIQTQGQGNGHHGKNRCNGHHGAGH